MTEDRDTILRRIGFRVARRRRDLGLTQKVVAERLAITSANISQIEAGERNLTIDTLCKLAEALEMTFAELVVGVRVPSAPDPEE